LLALSRQHTRAFALEVVKLGDRRLVGKQLLIIDVERLQQDAARSGETGDRLAVRRRVDHLAGMIVVLEQTGQRRHLETRVGAEEQFGGADRRFYSAEPQPFGLTRRAAELPGRIDFDFDLAAGRLLQFLFVDLDVFVLHIVERQRREFHHHLRLRWTGRYQTCRGQTGGEEPRQAFWKIPSH
jgi:hypothetical protein